MTQPPRATGHISAQINGGLNGACRWVELALTIFFTAEAGLRCLAAGGVARYLRDKPWNPFDVSLALLGFVQLIPLDDGPGSSGYSGVGVLQVRRAHAVSYTAHTILV